VHAFPSASIFHGRGKLSNELRAPDSHAGRNGYFGKAVCGRVVCVCCWPQGRDPHIHTTTVLDERWPAGSTQRPRNLDQLARVSVAARNCLAKIMKQIPRRWQRAGTTCCKISMGTHQCSLSRGRHTIRHTAGPL
jgi:hypothetical protein